MAAGTLPKPGTKYGPCDEPCMHKDCACTRAMAEARCIHCDKPIEYETPFYQVESPPPLDRQGDSHAWADALAHATCHENRVECTACGGMGGKSVGSSGACDMCGGKRYIIDRPLPRGPVVNGFLRKPPGPRPTRRSASARGRK